MRHFLLLLLSLVTFAGAAEDMAREVRQVVIRAPEMAVVEIMADTTTHATEAARVAALWQAVAAGKARVISDLTTLTDVGGGIFIRQGSHVWLPSELDQDTERLQMPPTAQEEHFVGTSLTGRCSFGVRVFQWQGVCVPRGPAMVKWPVSWLNRWIDYKPDPQKRLIRGWLDYHDTFQQETTGIVTLRSARMQILAVMPPADQIPLSAGDQPTAGPGRWLDVFLAQAKAPGQPTPTEPEREPDPTPAAPAAPAVPADPFAAPARPAPLLVKPLPQGQASMFYGISLSAVEAAALLRQRDPAQDATLLQKLLARVRAGTARLRLCIGSGNDILTRHSVKSARLHQIPTEMPSIPSAWDGRPFGTTLEMEMETFDLHQDLAPPGRTEWKLALDDPEAVMWQPLPRYLRLLGRSPALHGTHLLGLIHIPEVMRQPGTGLDTKEPESILFFGHYQSGHITADSYGNQRDERPRVEAEIIVLEIPGTSVDDFEGLPGDPQAGEEDDRFRQLMDRVGTGEVRIAAHTLVIGGHNRAEARIVEEHKHATEFDPPEDKDVPRMRPTALETVLAGTDLQINLTASNRLPFDIYADFTFKHSTGLPVEPGLPATLATAAKDEGGPYPFGEHPQETWSSSDRHAITGSSGYTLRDNRPYCLGARKYQGISRKVIHVAYLRARRL